MFLTKTLDSFIITRFVYFLILGLQNRERLAWVIFNVKSDSKFSAFLPSITLISFVEEFFWITGLAMQILFEERSKQMVFFLLAACFAMA